MHPERAYRLHRQEIAEQRAVGEIDRQRPAVDVGPAGALEPGEGLRRTRIVIAGEGVGDDVGNVGGVPQSHVEALRADRRQHVRGFAHQHHAPRREAFRMFDRQRKRMTATFDPQAAEDGMGPLLGGHRKVVVAQRHQPLSLVWACHPNHTRSLARQRHEHARTVDGVKFRRGVAMRAAMRHIEGDCSLVQRTPLHGNSSGIAADRVPPVGPDNEARLQQLFLPGAKLDRIVVRLDRVGVVVEPRHMGKLGGTALERLHQHAIFDVVAERFAVDFIAGKAHFRRADQAAGVVDQTHHAQRRGVRGTARPDAEPLQQIDRVAEQGRGPVVGIGEAPRHQGGLCPGHSESDRGDKSGRTAADHGNVEALRRGMQIGHGPRI